MPLYISENHDKIIKAPSKLHAEAHLGRQAHPTLKSLTIDGYQEAIEKGMKTEIATTSSEESGRAKPGPKGKRKVEPEHRDLTED